MADEYGGGGFLFGGNTGYTPETLAGARLKLAQAMMQQGLSTEPIRSPWQGAAHMLEAALGGYDMYKMQQEQNASYQPILDALNGGNGGSQNGSYFPPAPDAQGGSSPSATADAPSGSAPQVADVTSPSSATPDGAYAAPTPDASTATASAAPSTGIAAYIRQAAVARGIDPDIALRVAGHEGLYAFNPNKPDHGGDNGSSFGPFQLHYGGIARGMSHPGMGDDFTRDTGLDARNPSTWRQQVDYALDRARAGGWGPWMGAKAEGITGMRGIGKLPPPTQVASLDPGIGMPVPPNGGDSSIQPPQAPGPVAPTPGYRDPTVSAPNYVPPQGAQPQPQPQAPGPSSLHVSPEPVPESAYASPSQSPAVAAINQQAPIDPTQTASIPAQAAPQLDPPVNVAANPVPPQQQAQSAQFKAGAPWDNPPTPQQRLTQAASSLPPQQNANMQSPQFRALVGVLMNPYASPGAKQMAGTLLQQQMTPHTTVVSNPTTGESWLVNTYTGAKQLITQGQTADWEVQKDSLGNIIGSFNKRTNQFVPMQNAPSTNAMPPPNPDNAPQPDAPQAAAPQQAAPQQTAANAPQAQPHGQPTQAAPQQGPQAPRLDTAIGITLPKVKGENYLDGVLKNNPQWAPYVAKARAILRGDMPLPTGNAAEKPEDRQIVNLVYGADKDFNQTLAQQKGKTISEFTNTSDLSSPGGQVFQANKALNNMRKAAIASEALGKTQVRSIPGVYGDSGGSSTMNLAQEKLSSNNSDYGIASKAYEASLEPLRDELVKFFSGSSGTEASRDAIRDIFDLTTSPEQRRVAFQTLSNQLQDGTTELQRKWHQGIGPGALDFPVIGPEAQESIKYINGLGKQDSGQKGGKSPVTINGYTIKEN